MIMKCDHCGITYDSAYGHYHCVPMPGNMVVGRAPAEFIAPTKEVTVPVKDAEKRAIVPVDVIEAWDLSYNLGVAVDMIGQFSMSEDWEYLAEAIEALEREKRRVTGGQR